MTPPSGASPPGAPTDVREAGPPGSRPAPRRRLRLWAPVVVAVGVAVAALGIGAFAHGAAPAAPSSVPGSAAPATAAAPATSPAGQDPAGQDPTVDLRATDVALPTLGVRSTLVGLDIGPNGALAAPTDPAVAGWYVRGAAPGEPGPTVIAGHVDSQAGPAVFYRLDELRPGDRVEVTRSDGQVFAYRVATVEQHPKNDFPTTRVYGPTPGPELRLITCGGDFDHRSRHYRDNIIVTAIPTS